MEDIDRVCKNLEKEFEQMIETLQEINALIQDKKLALAAERFVTTVRYDIISLGSKLRRISKLQKKSGV